MKKITLFLLLLVAALNANAQFEKGKQYANLSFTGLGMSYSSNERFRFGLQAEGGYFISDCLLLKGNLGYDHTRYTDEVAIGAGARYYFDQCGVYLGGGLEFAHFTKDSNDLFIPLEVGYAFFINKFITIQPAIYYKMSTNDFGGGSTVGLKIGAGFYF